MMPEVVIHRRLSRRMERWYYRHRPGVAVTAAFATACLLGLAAASLGLRDAAPQASYISAPR